MPKEVMITAIFNDTEAWTFAQFLKRVGLDDYKSLSIDTDEAYMMQQAGEKLRKALAESGYEPR